MNKKIYYRFQNTLNIEKESYYVDINLAFEDFEEYSGVYPEKEDLFNFILDKYNPTFSLRKDIKAEELARKIETAYYNNDFNIVDDLMSKYKLPYIFGYEEKWIFNDVDSPKTIEEILDINTRPDYWNCENDTYLVVYEGEEILDEDLSGVIFKPTSIVKYYITDNYLN